MPVPTAEEPPRSECIVAVLGMHRSGTSALAGTLAEQGVDFGDVSRSNRFQPKGNHESRKLMRLHDRILRRCGGTWWDPPGQGAIDIRPRMRERLATILGEYESRVVGVKDPRMLVLMELWRDLPLARIGTLRNPVDVTRSLQARARELGEPAELADERRCERLWRHYNSLLLAEHDREPFPLLNFDEAASFGPGAVAALRSYGIAADREVTFFDPGLTANREDDWRADMEPETLALYDALAERAEA